MSRTRRPGASTRSKRATRTPACLILPKLKGRGGRRRSARGQLERHRRESELCGAYSTLRGGVTKAASWRIPPRASGERFARRLEGTTLGGEDGEGGWDAGGLGGSEVVEVGWVEDMLRCLRGCLEGVKSEPAENAINVVRGRKGRGGEPGRRRARNDDPYLPPSHGVFIFRFRIWSDERQGCRHRGQQFHEGTRSEQTSPFVSSLELELNMPSFLPSRLLSIRSSASSSPSSSSQYLLHSLSSILSLSDSQIAHTSASSRADLRSSFSLLSAQPLRRPRPAL